MKLYLSMILYVLLIASSLISAQVITSTTTGGNWSSTSTWIGGVVPGTANDVIINGNVTVDLNTDIKSLIINQNCTLEHDGGYWREINIAANFTNNGLARFKPGGSYDFTIRINGNTVNNGSLQNFLLTFSGENNHILSGSSAFSCKVTIEGSGDIYAGSDIRLDPSGYFQLDNGDVVNMVNYKLTLDDRIAAPFTQSWSDGKIVSNGQLEINGIFACNLDGNFTLTGTKSLIANGNFNIYGNFTVGAGKSVEYDGSYWREITVLGDLINYGTIKRTTTQSYDFTLKIEGNVQNNGKIETINLEYVGESEHIMSGNSFYSCDIYITGKGDIKAGSNIGLDSLGYFELDEGDILNMGNYKLTIDERINIPFTQSSADGKIFSNGDLEINGKYNCNLDGNFTLTGSKPLIAAGNFNVYGDLTVGPGKSVQYDGNYWREVTVQGNIINNGTIKRAPAQSYGFTLKANGNVQNNGRIEILKLEYTGDYDHIMSGNSFYSCDIYITGKGDVKGGSNLGLDSLGYFELDEGDSLIMGTYKLTIDERVNTPYSQSWSDGRIVSDGELEINGKFGCNLGGRFTITGNKPLLITNNITVFENLTIGESKILQHDGNYWRELTVKGDIINYGTIQNKPAGAYSFLIYAYRNFFNFGEVSIENIYIRGVSTHTFSGNYINSDINIDLENTIIAGDLNCKTIYVNKPAILKGNSTIQCSEIIYWENLINNGIVTGTQKVEDWYSGKSFPYTTVYTNNSMGLDSLTITVYGNQVPGTYSGAMKKWWRIKSAPSSGALLSTLRFHYSDNELGNNNEDMLELYHSNDQGRTWKQISTTSATERHPENNTIQFNNVPIEGDYLLSSNPDPVSVRTNICLSIIGRDRIRIGGFPNRYTFHYVNNSDITTGEILMRVAGQKGIFIESVEPSIPSGGSKIIIPVDSIAYDGKKDTIYLFVSPMGPREERSFDVIFTADNTNMLSKTNDTKILPLIGVVLWWGAAAITTAYVTDVTMNVSENIWQPVGCRSTSEALRDVLYESWQQTNNDWFCFEKPARAIAEAAGEEALKRGAGVVIPGKNIVEGAGRSMKGMERYLKGDFNVVTDCDGKNINPEGDATEQEYTLRKVTSFDPNEKTGPKGIGDNNFVTSAGRISYRIFFENKKEAEAPAWKILILDTLAVELNPETVNFEIKSHEGDNYNWQMEKLYNTSSGRDDILKWYIEGIELPPNVNPPEGEGYVTFSVEANPGLASGASIRNSATITFDINTPIRTNVWQNTLDFTAPVTTLHNLPAEIFGGKAVVRWASDDGTNGSGTSTTTIYGKKDEGGYEILGTSESDSLILNLSQGVYSFYALSKDKTGNVETVYNNIVSTAITSVTSDKLLPEEYALYQNYPNPFNPSTTIKFAVPFESNIRLEVFDIIGKRVALLSSIIYKPGYHSIKWDASAVSSGIYLLRLDAKSMDGNKSFTSTKKLMLLK